MKRRILALVMALMMTVGLGLPVSAEGLGDGVPMAITDDSTITPPTTGDGMATEPTTGDSTLTEPTTDDSTTTPPTSGDSTTTHTTPVDSEKESDTPAPLGMTASMSVGAAPTTTPSVGETISYKAWDGSRLVDAFIADTDTARTEVTDSTDTTVTWNGGETAENAKWYVVKGSDVVITGGSVDNFAVEVTGHVNLLLCDSAKLTITGGIRVKINDGKNSSLTVYAQSIGENAGKLTVSGVDKKVSGISIYKSGLTVNGGVIEANGSTSGNTSYGISISSEGSSMTVNSGKITATGQSTENAVSSGICFENVNNNAALTINGGEVIAIGGAASGVVGRSYGINNNGGIVTITSGKVRAEGGSGTRSYGIENHGTVMITGGTVIAKRGAGSDNAVSSDFGTLNLPTVPYWWRTAVSGDSALYKTQRTYTDKALVGEYFEVTTTQPADDQLDRVGYLDWDAVNNKLNTELTYCEGAIEVAGHYDWGEADKDTWYYVKARLSDGHLRMEGTVNIKGNVHLILCDNAILNLEGSIKIEQGASLTIYGQTEQTGMVNILGPGRGNGISINQGSLTINGGEMKARGGSLEGTSSGIQVGGSYKGIMTVNSGKVTATGGGGTNISISFGISVRRNNSSLTINGGEVTAEGIAAKERSYGIFHDSNATVMINGGTVIAKRAAGDGQAVSRNTGTLNLPTVPYWWRTAASGDSALYKTQRTYTNNALIGEYFELTTTPQTSVDTNEAVQTVDYMDWDEVTGALKPAACSDYVPVIDRTGDATWGVMASEEPVWYYVAADTTINGTVTLTGDVCLILGDGAKLTVTGGISGNAKGLTIYGQVNQQGELVTIGAEKSGCSGIEVDTLTVNGGMVDATGADTDKLMSCGIHVGRNFTINTGKVTTTGGKATEESYGVYLVNRSRDIKGDTYEFKMISGTLIARTLADSCGKKAAMHYSNDRITLPKTYWWRTVENGSFTGCASGEHSYVNGTNTYVEITSARPEGWVDPSEQDKEQDRTDSSSAQQPIHRQNDKVKVTSPETFDAGFTVYAVMGVMSAAASAVLIDRRKKR